jgi:hypothetical protein
MKNDLEEPDELFEKKSIAGCPGKVICQIATNF